MSLYHIIPAPYRRFSASLRVLQLSSLSALALSTLVFSGCEVGEVPENQSHNPMSCIAIPECGPEQREVDSCEGQDDSCQEVAMCGQTIFCVDGDPELCGAAPPCLHIENSIERDSCDDAVGECYEVTGCGQTTYCEVVPEEAG